MGLLVADKCAESCGITQTRPELKPNHLSDANNHIAGDGTVADAIALGSYSGPWSSLLLALF